MACAGLLGQGLAEPAGVSREGGALVPPEEYPVFDRVVESKFLTSRTRLVVVERPTVRYLHPEIPVPPTVGWFESAQPFSGRLPEDLIADFVVKNQQAARLEDRFRFGVHIRFVTPEGLAEPDIRFAPRPRRWMPRLVEQETHGPPPTLDRLAFSRVGFNLAANQALVYVVNDRPDGSGAGFLLWLHRPAGEWALVETDVLWVAQPAGEESSIREYDRS
ncbi:hypothetical protein YTPLAS18_27910 [Nitrospira sp.]|nr:hypothetical protein YTPLAS18_27910 [Nitrospira sp.]